ncbi:inactive hydroxysteroid dehydrogenase-like protein 1 [Phlebotomus argentipes]|uniref:inactive hydroxysteroid dehydrogenase-like protein 1 n=1 Tax=Phlebotomus argentipes TaxID=94469 RepID=UPI002892A478|nr:inactive hydroxysteroid dehydrogenase-like protein 1 [Phlebotomus argentipes]
MFESLINSLSLNVYVVIVILLSIAGIWAIISWAYDNLRSLVLIVKAVLAPYFLPQENQTLAEKYGNWAVITGSTDGIGKQYARELASRGINVVLISRTEKKLVEVANEIEQDFHVKTKWIAADFSQGRDIYPRIEEELRGIPVGILVNNVGRMYDGPDSIGHVPEDLLWDMVNINCGAVTMMTRLLLSGMVERRKGAIVNISSGSELQPMPYMAVYGATKAYVRNFTLAIRNELAPYGITVQLVSPMFVVTKMNQYSERLMTSNIMIPDVKMYTRSMIFTLGKSDQTTGYWSHAVQYAFMKMVPEWVRLMIATRMNSGLSADYYAQLKQDKNDNIETMTSM